MRRLLLATALLLTAAPALAADAAFVPAAGTYAADPAHTSVTWRVMHLGLSNYTARFTKIDSTLRLDPARPADAKLAVTIDANSVRTDFPNPAKVDFDKEIGGSERFLNGAKFPEIKFVSTRIVMTGPKTAKITGDLTLRGVTRPVTLEAVFNGATPGNPNSPPRMGFSARGTLTRSDFGMTFGTQFVSDRVELIVETEYLLGA